MCRLASKYGVPKDKISKNFTKLLPSYCVKEVQEQYYVTVKNTNFVVAEDSGGGRGASAPPKVLIWWKSGQNRSLIFFGRSSVAENVDLMRNGAWADRKPVLGVTAQWSPLPTPAGWQVGELLRTLY